MYYLPRPDPRKLIYISNIYWYIYWYIYTYFHVDSFYFSHIVYEKVKGTKYQLALRKVLQVLHQKFWLSRLLPRTVPSDAKPARRETGSTWIPGKQALVPM